MLVGTKNILKMNLEDPVGHEDFIKGSCFPGKVPVSHLV